MDDRDERQQLEELRALLKRADRFPSRGGAVRKDALKRLIEVVHSPYTSLKILAASNIKIFINDFPELEDEAINAVYDLCEDSVAKVRIEGYHAIILVSKEQKKWVKRNADVLVQLLQSDEPEEVVVVKKALIEHLDMDPVVTLGVLCDQIVPLEDLDEEDQSIRNRLRSLVLAFLTGEAHRGITERHANALGSPAEEVLVNEVLKAIPKLPHTDVNVAVKDLLLSLTSFSTLSSRGDQLLEVVLDVAKSSLKTELASGVAWPPLPNTTFYLELGSLIAVQKRVANPRSLLRFYCTSVVSKMTLMRLSEEAKAFVLSQVADALSACEGLSQSNNDEMAVVRKQTVDSCILLLPCLLDIQSVARPWKACRILIQACNLRKDQLGWSPQPVLVETLKKIQDLADVELKQDSHADKALLQEVQSLIRLLLPSKIATPPPPSSVNARGANKDKDKPNGTPVTIQRNRDHSRSITAPLKPSSLPPKPPSAGQVANGTFTAREDRHRLSTGSITSVARQLGSNVAASSSSTLGQTPPSRAMSKTESGTATPSLLSRMALLSNAPATDPLSSRVSTPTIPAKRRAEPPGRTPPVWRPHSPPPSSIDVDTDMNPTTGWSIRGAARRTPSGGDATVSGQTSLLERLTGENDSGDHRGKKRTRNY